MKQLNKTVELKTFLNYASDSCMTVAFSRWKAYFSFWNTFVILR